MKFDDLYNRVFVKEAAPSDVNTEVATPEDFDDVDPIPLPEPAAATDAAAATPAMQTSSSITEYMKQCLDFAEKLQSANGDCLQSLILSLDKPATPFEGISRLSTDVENAAEKLKSISGRILSYTIAAAKK
jgi:hypothetical protein